MERDAGWLLEAQLCLLTAEFMFYVTNHLVGQEKAMDHENSFTGIIKNQEIMCLQMMPEIRVALFGANPNRKFMD